MLFKLIKHLEEQKTTFQPYMRRSASELKLIEKDLENWMAENPELLFGGEQVLVIGQSVAGQRMADILALDADGRLVVVEIKQDWSDRATVGQLLEYAAHMARSNYDDLERLARRYWNDENACLLDRFQKLTDDDTAERGNIPNGQRVCIVAPGSDEELQRIVQWLREYGVPISFVPFALYADNDAADILLEMEPLPEVQAAGENGVDEWQENWFFNTNETYGPGAYRRMFDQDVIAIYGYETGPANLTGSTKDQRVFAYVNGRGILAVGRIVDGQVVPGDTVFDEEYHQFHVEVNWEKIVADDKGITNRQVRDQHGYNLPVRNTFCKMYCPPAAADWIAAELQRRAE